MSHSTDRSATAALSALIVLQVVMLTALYTNTQPHPPATIPLFGIAPFLAASMSAALAAIVMGPMDTRIGKALSLLAAVCALVSFGPQKYLDASFALIWPSVVAGQIAALALVIRVIRSGKSGISVGSA